MALLCPIGRVNTTAEGAFPYNKGIALTLEEYGLWKYPVEIPKKKKNKSTY